MQHSEFSLLEMQQNIHELIAQKHPLEEVLPAITDWIEVMMPTALVSIMRFNPETQALSMVPSPQFSSAYVEQLQGISIGDGKGTCGTAAYRRKLVITEDIRTDPKWKGFQDIAEAEGVRACWSMPILTANGELLGTFASYYRSPVAPTEGAQRNLSRGAALVALAILRQRDTEDHSALSEWHRTLFENHPDGVYTFDLEGRFLNGNSALERITGYPVESLVGVHFNQFIQPEAQTLTQAAFDKASRGEAVTYETAGIHADGRHYDLEIINFPVRIKERIVGVYGVCKDITERKAQEVQIRYQATHDLVTGLPNQAAFNENLEKLMDDGSARKQGLAVLHFDLDGFKPINEGLGHQVGNQVIQIAARRMQACLPENAILARLVGDEFGAAVPGFTSADAISGIADQILQALAEPIEVDPQMIHISASIGIAAYTADVKQPQQLLQFADLALERAKRKGRNIWQWYRPEEGQRLKHSVTLRHEVQTALRENQFEVYYQPLVDSLTGRIRSVEALVRWQHPDRGMVSPGDFIPLAEQTGQIVPLGLWVLKQACQEVADLNTGREQSLRVAVNISSLQFIRDGFLDDVFRILDETGLPPRLLELEVTESVLIEGADHVIGVMEALKHKGIRVALDDFGTGFSSLSYLRDLPTHKVKLDRSFIQKIETDRRIAAIVQGVITMAHHMDMIVVAEGIETLEQQEDLARRHCDLLQGYLFARPMPMAELMALPDILPVESNA